MDWLIDTLRDNPSIAIFLTIVLGFWIGKFKYKTFSLGNVTSVLLVGVLIGQLDIPIPGPVKNVFFLLFLFAIGYSVGPQFFRSLRGSGVKEVIFAVVVCVLVLVTTIVAAKIMGYNLGEAVGLFSGSATISAAIGVGSDTINSLGLDPAKAKAMINIIPVAYAVTYIFGTIGSAYLLSAVGPWMLGGLKKVREDTAALEAEMNRSDLSSDPAYINALRPVAFRAYKVTAELFSTPQSVESIEKHFIDKGYRIFVERLRINGKLTEPQPQTMVGIGDEIVLSGRREYIITDESWIGPEINDAELLNFPAEQLSVLISKKGAAGMTVDQLRRQKYMYGIAIKELKRSDTPIPVMAQTVLQAGDTITIIGLAQEVNVAAPKLGYVDRPSQASNLILLGFGLTIGCLIGAIAIKIGGVPVSLSTSGGALIAGLICGWLRAKRPSIGNIPSQSIWVLNNLGLNTFIAVIGITAGPSFVSGIEQVGFTMFIVGMLVTTIPLLLAVWIGAKLFKFRPAINLGCCAGARTTTAALGAIQDSLGSTVPAMGYTITYAIGNTLLILWGVVIVLVM
ncbi:MAG: aspartate-alanine antiporter [Paramuribaculum sp.]|nr:aspartate-alanine antiporter [Paramuribaculum sp.]